MEIQRYIEKSSWSTIIVLGWHNITFMGNGSPVENLGLMTPSGFTRPTILCTSVLEEPKVSSCPWPYISFRQPQTVVADGYDR